MLETTLKGAQEHRASVVIIDITGVRIVDSDVATTLMRTASALRLLGTDVVLTGIRAEVARTLAELEIDLGAVVTQGTLQKGIAYALKKTGEGSMRLQRS
jgi:rsbT co-antagonist protein RsbR